MKTTSCFVIAALLVAGAPAAQRIIAIDSNRALSTLNPVTGAKTPVAVVGAAIGTPRGLAFDATAGTLFGVSGSGNALYTIDLVTGAATLVGGFGNPSMSVFTIEYDSTHDVLYTASSHDGGLYTVDRVTGVATFVGATGIAGAINLAHDSDTDTLYATGTAADCLFVVDRVTGAGTLIGNLQQSAGPQGLAYDSQLGVLLMVDNSTDLLYAIDRTTGRAHVIGSTGPGNLLGLAYIPAGTGSLDRLAHRCGEPTITGFGHASIGGALTVQLDGITGTPFVGFGQSMFAWVYCGCTIGHEWAAVVGGAGATLQIPMVPTLIGAKVRVQGADLGGVGGCADPQVALTDTLVLTVG